MLIVSLAISTSQAGFAEDAAGFPNGHREALGPLYGAAPDHRAGARGGRAIKRRKRNETPACSADIPVCGFWGLSSPQAVEEHGAGKHREPADKNVCYPAKQIPDGRGPAVDL